MTWILIKLGVRFAVFGGVFGFFAWKDERVTVQPKYALPLVALVFALLNTALYWILRPILDLATLGSMGFVLPFALNGFFLYGTARLLKPLKIEGWWPMMKMAGFLTVAHGVLWVFLDYIEW